MRQGATNSSGKNGKGRGSGSKTCWVCGATDHISKKCPKRVQSVEEPSGASAAVQSVSPSVREEFASICSLTRGQLEEPCQLARSHLSYLCAGAMEVNAVGTTAKETDTIVELTVDSGAEVSVVPPEIGNDYVLHPTEHAKRGGYFVSADGGKLYDRGCRVLALDVGTQVPLACRMHVCDVRKPLLSVTALQQQGCRVEFSESGASITHAPTGMQIPLTRRGGCWVLRARLLPKSSSPVSVENEGVMIAALDEAERGILPIGEASASSHPEGRLADDVEAHELEDEDAGVRAMKYPRQPSTAEREEHECRGHVPFRSWCDFCCVGRG
eukprot:6484702-Amphidinium_carterae.1